MYRIIKGFMMFCMVSLSVMCVAAVGYAAALTLKLSHPQPENHVYHKSALVIADELKKRSGGSMELQIYPNSLMGNETTVIDLVQAGALDMMCTSTPILAKYDKLYQMFSLPFLFDNEQHLYKSFDNPAVTTPLAASLIKSKGVRPVGYWLTGARNFCSTKSVSSLADFKGIKVRCMEDPFIVEAYASFGATPVPMPFPDVYTGLQTGSVTATEIPLNTYIHNKFYEVANNAAVINTNYLMMLVVVSEQTWSRLNEEQRQWLSAAVKASEVFERKAMEQDMQTVPAKLKDLKVNVTYPERAAFQQAVRPVYERFSREFGSEAYGIVQSIRTW